MKLYIKPELMGEVRLIKYCREQEKFRFNDDYPVLGDNYPVVDFTVKEWDYG